ncbi:MAG: glycoside hydrolase family 99-like domain-containing protein [Burkholderiales bacterium]|nr:glycoside hydrolase family 99-like domain-containing protein [Bacteroidia bacterium]
MKWTNVTKTTTLFNALYQTHFPADLGFYYLMFEEACLAKEALAKQFSFCDF